MRSRPFFLLFLLAGVLLISSCSEDVRITKNLYDDWWPIHATGSQETSYFTARWDGDLNGFGGIEVTFTDKTNPTLQYKQTIYYKALSFKNDRKSFCYIDISSYEMPASRLLNFYVKNKLIFFEKPNEAGRGSGEYEEGKSISFPDNDHIIIDGVKYERYSVYYEAHRPYGNKTERITSDGRIPVVTFK